MRARHASFHENMLSLCRYCLVIPMLVALGCASKPNLIPYGAPALMQYDGVRRIAAAIDYPVLITTAKDDTQVKMRWTYRGAWVWGEKPFATADRVQFILRQPGGNTTLCDSNEIKNTGKEDETYDCKFDVRKYTAEPLVGELNYWFGEKTGDEASLPDVVLRTYYLIEQPKPKN